MGAKTAVTALLLFLAAGCAPNMVAGEEKEKKGAEEMLGEARAFHEAMVPFRKAEAMIGTAAENGDEQVELFRKAIGIKPDFLEAHYNLGLVHLNRKEMAEAAAAFETVLRIDPQFDPEVYRLLATAYRGAGDPAAAIAALEAGVARRPEDLEMLKALAYLELRNGREGAAAENLEKVVARDPADGGSRFELALLYQKRGDAERAAAHYRELLERAPDHFAARFNLGMLLLGGGKLAEGTAELEEAARQRPEDAQVRERLGDAYSLMQQYEKAAASYRAALAGDPARPRVLSRLGFALAKLGRTGEAIEVLEGAAGPGAEGADVHFLLGDLYGDAGRYEEALRSYARSLEADPGQKEVHYNMGTLLAERERFDEARASLRRAVQLDPRYAPAWANLARVAERLGLDREGIEANEAVIELGEGTARNYFHLGVLYAKNDLAAPAIAAFTRAVELEPERYRALLREELKNVQSVLDSVRYKPEFTRLLDLP
jgi:superkiller protein 3